MPKRRAPDTSSEIDDVTTQMERAQHYIAERLRHQNAVRARCAEMDKQEALLARELQQANLCVQNQAVEVRSK